MDAQNLFLGVSRSRDPNLHSKEQKNNIFMEKIGWEFCNNFFLVLYFDLKLRSVDPTLQTISFENFAALCLYFLLIEIW